MACTVGVVQDNCDRNTMHINTNNGFWVIERNYSSYSASEVSPVVLSLEETPERVGVLRGMRIT